MVSKFKLLILCIFIIFYLFDSSPFSLSLCPQNIGYCIPVRVVEHFLDDIAQHEGYTSFPKLGFRWQKIENPSLKKYLQMVDDDYDPNNDDEEEKGAGDGGTKKVMNGVLVNMCYPMTDCKAKLEENDVVLEIDGVEIGEDGTIAYPFPEDGVSRINYTYITTNKFCGDAVDLKILRGGEVQSVKVTLNIIDYLGTMLMSICFLQWLHQYMSTLNEHGDIFSFHSVFCVWFC